MRGREGGGEVLAHCIISPVNSPLWRSDPYKRHHIFPASLHPSPSLSHSLLSSLPLLSSLSLPSLSLLSPSQHPLLDSDFFEGDLTAQALEVCKKTVLKPYLIFLKLVSLSISGGTKCPLQNYFFRLPCYSQTTLLVGTVANE